MRFFLGMKKWRNRIRHSAMVAGLYSAGLLEAYYLPRYGIEWLLGALAATAFLAGFWLKARWEV